MRQRIVLAPATGGGKPVKDNGYATVPELAVAVVSALTSPVSLNLPLRLKSIQQRNAPSSLVRLVAVTLS